MGPSVGRCRLEKTLYVETNFVVGLAKGQDPEGAALLNNDYHDINIIFPSLCFMESISTWAFEKKRRTKFSDELQAHAQEIKRDRTEPTALPLAEGCGEVRLGIDRHLRYMSARLNHCLSRLNDLAARLNPDVAMIHEALSNDYIIDPTDNLIYCCVLLHARLNHAPTARKAFVTGNYKDFDRADLIGPLKQAGVSYFRTTANALGWLRRPLDSSPIDPS